MSVACNSDYNGNKQYDAAMVSQLSANNPIGGTSLIPILPSGKLLVFRTIL